MISKQCATMHGKPIFIELVAAHATMGELATDVWAGQIIIITVLKFYVHLKRVVNKKISKKSSRCRDGWMEALADQVHKQACETLVGTIISHCYLCRMVV